MSTPTQPPQVNDIVQLDPGSEIGKDYGPQLCIVDKIASWGVRAYFIQVQTRGEFGAAYVRLATGSFAVVGHAVWGATD